MLFIHFVYLSISILLKVGIVCVNILLSIDVISVYFTNIYLHFTVNMYYSKQYSCL